MLNSFKGLWLTLVSTFNGLRDPVTRQYPATGKAWRRSARPTPVQPRFMGFPALTWDADVEEPFCTSCMVCVRQCPTHCMSATMQDNPAHAEGRSHRRKIVENFEINLNRCILCGICVEVCNFDAIVMTHEHEMSAYRRDAARVDLPALLAIGKKFQNETGWQPAPARTPQRTSAAPAARGSASEGASAAGEGPASNQGGGPEPSAAPGGDEE